jgi:hypothetical protein
MLYSGKFHVLEDIVYQFLEKFIQKWKSRSHPSYMVYLGREIPASSEYQAGYVTDTMLQLFLASQPFFDSYTIWDAKGCWKGTNEDTIVIEIFDQPLDKVRLFALEYKSTFAQEAVYIKISDTTTELI